MFEKDKSVIENKYHDTKKPFDPYNRMAYHGYAFDTATGMEDDEIIENLRRKKGEWADLPHSVAKAYAVKYVLEHTKIDVNESDWFVGLWSLNRLPNVVTQKEWYREVFEEKIPDVAKEMADMNESGAVSIWPDFDHVVPDWAAILSLGFSGILARAKAYKRKAEEKGELTGEKRAFYDGILISYGAIVELIDRLCAYAKGKKHDKAEKIAACLESIRDGAPKDTYEALQTIYLYFILSECFDSFQVRSLGNGLDSSLLPFFERDLQSGRYTEEEIREFLKYFLMQWSAIGNYWGQPFYLGGTKADGSTKYSRLSYLILDVYDEIGIYNPKIQAKFNENTPKEISDKIFDMIRHGHNGIVCCLEPAIIKAVMGYGGTYEEGLNADIRGCYETGVRANEVSTATGYINPLKAVTYVFTNGYEERLGKTFALQTGDLESMKTFEDFYRAVLRQWEFLIEKTIKTANAYEKYLSYINPSDLYSGTVVSALQKGVDGYQGGVKFNNSAILDCGFASFVDCIMAVKTFVYEKKAVSLSVLAEALQNNWEGYETLRTAILKSEKKYGNGDEETDRYTAALSAYFTNKVNNRPNGRGGVYKACMHSAMQFVWQGEKTGATPDGRKSGEEISKNASPSVRGGKNGVTSTMLSAVATLPCAYWESHCLDVTLHPSAVEGEEGLAAMRGLVLSYMRMGGQSVQFNVFDAEKLKDAQKHPERYENLQVRVCGWNVLWNRLSKAEQNAYIERAQSGER